MTSKEHILSLLRAQKPELMRFGVKGVGLFGSYAHNTQTTRSDIDLLIDFHPDQENFDNYMAVYDMLQGLFINEKVELVTKNGLSKYLGPKILSDVLYV